MPRYIRVKILTPEEEAAERRARIILFLTVAGIAIQLVGIFLLSRGIADSSVSQIVTGAIVIPLGLSAGQSAESRLRRRPFKTRRVIVGTCVAIAMAVLLGRHAFSV
jgi:hypothetical protein